MFAKAGYQGAKRSSRGNYRLLLGRANHAYRRLAIYGTRLGESPNCSKLLSIGAI